MCPVLQEVSLLVLNKGAFAIWARLLDRLLSALSQQGRDNSACHPLQGDEAAEAQEEEDETAALFRLAAEQLKEKREEEAMSVEERILKCVP